jgi:ABC-type transport system involved in cytochrome bd biosynthesis fused ATPase/permease subunit
MMLIVAIAWIYVVGLMALTEPSFVAGLMTFLLYCLIPLSILFYLTGSKRRKRRAERRAERKATATAADDKAKTADT